MFGRFDGAGRHADAGRPFGAFHWVPGGQQRRSVQQAARVPGGIPRVFQRSSHGTGQLHAFVCVQRQFFCRAGSVLERQHALPAVQQGNEAVLGRAQAVKQAQPGGSGHARAQHMLHHAALVHRHGHHHHLRAFGAQP